MAFGTKTPNTPKQTAAKKPGGRFSGLRLMPETPPELRGGEYVLEIKLSGENREHTACWLQGVVIHGEGEERNPEGQTRPCTADGETVRIYINHGDYSDEIFARLLIAVLEAPDLESVVEMEPNCDHLVDAICAKSLAEEFRRPGEDAPAFGVNPLEGMRIFVRMRPGKNISTKTGFPFCNPQFGPCPEEYKK